MTNTKKNYIHPTAVIGKNCTFHGSGNYVGPYCVLDNCTIGSNNRFESHVCIGSWPEIRPRTKPSGYVLIMDDCEFREFVTVNSGLTGATCIGSGSFLLTKSHVGHDAIIEAGVTLSCAALIGGHSFVGAGANIGLGAVVHQRRAIGAYAMVGMNSVVSKHLPPGKIAFNREKPYATVQGPNTVGLERAGNPDLLYAVVDWADMCNLLE